MTRSQDFAVRVYSETTNGDHFARNRHVGIRQNQTVKFQLDPTFAEKAPQVAVTLEPTNEKASWGIATRPNCRKGLAWQLTGSPTFAE